MRISHNHSFERRLGLWKAGFDADGELYCDQRYADWPVDMEKPAFDNPPWMLLSYEKDVEVSWEAENVTGVNILWEYAPEKLYHSCMVYGKCHRKIGALVKGQPVFVRVDTFNENGITEGEVMEVNYIRNCS